MGKLSYLCGPSHSGKSTFCSKWIQEQDPDGFYRVVVNTDSLRKAICGTRYNKYTEPVVFNTKYYMITALWLQGYHVLNDGTNTTDTSIRRLLEIDPNAKPIILNVPLDICIDRIKLTEQKDMVPVITRQYNQLQKILKEGIDNVHARLLKEVETRWKTV